MDECLWSIKNYEYNEIADSLSTGFTQKQQHVDIPVGESGAQSVDAMLRPVAVNTRSDGTDVPGTQR